MIPIRRRTLGVVLLVFGLSMLAIGITSYRDAAHEVEELFDANLAQNALTAETPEDRSEALDKLRAGVARATRLVTQLLTLARLDPEEESRDATDSDLLQEVREALAKLSPLATDQGIELLLDADEAADWHLQVEPGAIDTLIQNLVGNALQHSPDGGTIRVTLSASDGRVTLCVDDQGPGIPAEECERVIERFHRAGPGAGAGLGLSIVDRLLQRHGGRLALEDAPDLDC